MLSTILAVILLVCLCLTLELSYRASTGHTHRMLQKNLELAAIKGELLEAQKEASAQLQARNALQGTLGATQGQVQSLQADLYAEKAVSKALEDMHDELKAFNASRIDRLQVSLEESRKGRRHYYDESVERAKEIGKLTAKVTELELAVFTFKYDQESSRIVQRRDSLTIYELRAKITQLGRMAHAAKSYQDELERTNLVALHKLDPLAQENKLDAICEVLKTLMQQGKLDSTAVASFGGRLSRAVQVYRKAQQQEAKQEFNPLVALLALEDDGGHCRAPSFPDF